LFASTGHYVLGKKPLGIILVKIETDLLALLQASEAIALDRGIMYEYRISILNLD
jgi:hypothetical protein